MRKVDMPDAIWPVRPSPPQLGTQNGLGRPGSSCSDLLALECGFRRASRSGSAPVRVLRRMALPGFTLSRDGKVLALGNVNDGILLHRVANGSSTRLPSGDEELGSLAISWDGRLLAAGGSDLCGAVLGHRIGTRTSFFGPARYCAAVIEFTADGKSLISCSPDAEVRFWNVALRKELMSVPNYSPMKYFLLLSPDGSALAMPAPSSGNRGKVTFGVRRHWMQSIGWKAPKRQTMHARLGGCWNEREQPLDEPTSDRAPTVAGAGSGRARVHVNRTIGCDRYHCLACWHAFACPGQG